jgi:DNA-binding transcriptional ArsR family regulator
MELTNKQITVVFKALCDENRVQIIRLLQNGEKCACRLLEAMQCTQPTLSHHMKILCDSGLVVGRDVLGEQADEGRQLVGQLRRHSDAAVFLKW